MNKHSIIVIVASVFIIVPFLLSGFNILGAHQLEYRWVSDDAGDNDFSFFNLSHGNMMEFCNTVPFWTNYQKFEILPYYGDVQIGEFTTTNLELEPNSSKIQYMTFRSDNFMAAQHTFMDFDFQFNGGGGRSNASQFNILIQTSTPILGIIPYTTTNIISGFEFDQYMNQKTLSCDN